MAKKSHKQQTTVTVILNVIVGAFLAVLFFDYQPFSVQADTAKRTVALTALMASFIMSLVLFLAAYVLASWAIDSGRILAYFLTIIVTLGAFKVLVKTTKLWSKLN